MLLTKIISYIKWWIKIKYIETLFILIVSKLLGLNWFLHAYVPTCLKCLPLVMWEKMGSPKMLISRKTISSLPPSTCIQWSIYFLVTSDCLTNSGGVCCIYKHSFVSSIRCHLTAHQGNFITCLSAINVCKQMNVMRIWCHSL